MKKKIAKFQNFSLNKILLEILMKLFSISSNLKDEHEGTVNESRLEGNREYNSACYCVAVITLTFIFPERKRLHQMIKNHETMRCSLRVIWVASLQIPFYLFYAYILPIKQQKYATM